MSRRITGQSESGFQATLVEMARRLGWRVAHFRRAKVGAKWMTPVAADGAGWPDLVLARAGVVIFAELKVGRNRTTAEQDAWLADLRAAGLTAVVWYPHMWDEIEKTLKGDG